MSVLVILGCLCLFALIALLYCAGRYKQAQRCNRKTMEWDIGYQFRGWLIQEEKHYHIWMCGAAAAVLLLTALYACALLDAKDSTLSVPKVGESYVSINKTDDPFMEPWERVEVLSVRRGRVDDDELYVQYVTLKEDGSTGSFESSSTVDRFFEKYKESDFGHRMHLARETDE